MINDTNKQGTINIPHLSIVDTPQGRFCQHKLVFSGSDPVPVEINTGGDIRRQHISTTQEECDNFIVHQVASVGGLVVADDTYMIVLLLHVCYHGHIPFKVMVVSPIKKEACIDIHATIHNHIVSISDLLHTHDFTGCDTVAPCYGIGKHVGLKVLL